MFKRRPMRNKLLDNLHKGFVISCIGLTCYGLYLFGSRYYRYFTVVRPTIKEKEAEEERNLLSEGKATPESSLLIDSASNLKA